MRFIVTMALKTGFELITQLIEHCTSIAEVMGSNPVQAKSIFQTYNSQLL